MPSLNRSCRTLNGAPIQFLALEPSITGRHPCLPVFLFCWRGKEFVTTLRCGGCGDRRAAGDRLWPICRRHQEIAWALNAAGAAVQDVCVDRRRCDVLMTQKLLNGSDVVACFQQMRGEAVAQRVRAYEACAMPAWRAAWRTARRNTDSSK